MIINHKVHGKRETALELFLHLLSLNKNLKTIKLPKEVSKPRQALIIVTDSSTDDMYVMKLNSSGFRKAYYLTLDSK